MKDFPAVENFKDTVLAAARRYRGMSQDKFMAALLALTSESGRDTPDAKIVDLLKVEASAGSIDAAAALWVIGEHFPKVERMALDAITDVAMRSADIKEELTIQAITEEFEAFADEEVAAGRMTVRFDPKTGRKLYGSVKGNAP